jgi:hypothetical protein
VRLQTLQFRRQAKTGSARRDFHSQGGLHRDRRDFNAATDFHTSTGKLLPAITRRASSVELKCYLALMSMVKTGRIMEI